MSRVPSNMSANRSKGANHSTAPAPPAHDPLNQMVYVVNHSFQNWMFQVEDAAKNLVETVSSPLNGIFAETRADTPRAANSKPGRKTETVYMNDTFHGAIERKNTQTCDRETKMKIERWMNQSNPPSFGG
mmetsp:Transcript_41153/g.129267  ORF Transcript_41153/g.129267 Transcript_41153/m.129267 type:complete len:130 (-) Transcript_41153:784-1173(-)